MTDPVKILFDSFNVFAAAPGGVKKLKELILQLAVQGKLVEQDPNDEPASESLKKIKAERERLVAEGKIKKAKPLPPIEQGEVPFDVPEGWEWVRITDITTKITDGEHIQPKTTGNGVLLLSAKHIWPSGVDPKDAKYVSPEDAKRFRQRCDPEDGDLLVVGRGSIGKCCTVQEGLPEFCLMGSVIQIRFPQQVTAHYPLSVFYSTHGQTQLFGRTKTMAQPALYLRDIKGFPFPLPPLPEQHRIVARVDQLMGLCDEMEGKYNARQEQRQTLNAAALETILTAKDQAEFDIAWQQVVDSFDLLYDDPGSVPKLRQAILQLAVMGKLVPQDPNDESVPIEVNEPKRKYDARLFEKLKESITVPSRWKLEPLCIVSSAVVDCPHSTPKWTDRGKICVRTSQFRPGYLDLSGSRFVSEATFLERIQRLAPRNDDILYSREGGILGVACRVPADTQICLGQRMMLIRPRHSTRTAFLEIVLNSPTITEIARRKTTGGAAPRVNVKTVLAYPIPVPPLGEQDLIVDKVDQLMSLCDEMEAKLNVAREGAERLIGAVVGSFQGTPPEPAMAAVPN